MLVKVGGRANDQRARGRGDHVAVGAVVEHSRRSGRLYSRFRWERAFMRALHSRTLFFEAPHAFVYILVTLNIAVFFLCLHYSGAMVIPTEMLFRNGAMYPRAINRRGILEACRIRISAFKPPSSCCEYALSGPFGVGCSKSV